MLHEGSERHKRAKERNKKSQMKKWRKGLRGEARARSPNRAAIRESAWPGQNREVAREAAGGSEREKEEEGGRERERFLNPCFILFLHVEVELYRPLQFL